VAAATGTDTAGSGGSAGTGGQTVPGTWLWDTSSQRVLTVLTASSSRALALDPAIFCGEERSH
jgi:hypothetical protein